MSTDNEIAERVILGMAHSRETYKNKLTQYIKGALREFYKARLAEKNGYTRWVQHWKTEVTRLLLSLKNMLNDSIKGSWNRQKALDEVISDIKKLDLSLRNSAFRTILGDFEISHLKYDLDDNDSKNFFDRVFTITEEELRKIQVPR